MALVKTDVEDLYKDTESGGLINRDKDGLASYKRQKSFNKKVDNLEKKIANMEKQIETLYELVCSQP